MDYFFLHFNSTVLFVHYIAAYLYLPVRKKKWIDDLGATMRSIEKKIVFLRTGTCAIFGLINRIYTQISI